MSSIVTTEFFCDMCNKKISFEDKYSLFIPMWQEISNNKENKASMLHDETVKKKAKYLIEKNENEIGVSLRQADFCLDCLLKVLNIKLDGNKISIQFIED